MINYDTDWGEDYSAPREIIDHTRQQITRAILSYLHIREQDLTILCILILNDLFESAYQVQCSYPLPHEIGQSAIGQYGQLTLIVYETADGSLSVSDTQPL